MLFYNKLNLLKNNTTLLDTSIVLSSPLFIFKTFLPTFTNVTYSLNYNTAISYFDYITIFELLNQKKYLPFKMYTNWVADNVQLLPNLDIYFVELHKYQSDVKVFTSAAELIVANNQFYSDLYQTGYTNLQLCQVYDSYSFYFLISAYTTSALLTMKYVSTLLIVIFFYYNLVTTVTDSSDFYTTRVFNYFYSISNEIRIQFEVVLYTILFFIFFWSTTLMTFDDSKEEVIEFIDSNFFYFFMLIITYLIFKHSTHYFSFLESSVVEGRSVSFITKQVFKDFLNSVSLMFRFYILLLRVNVYDTLDDFLDSYYICVGDFDEDEYITELVLTLNKSLFFLLENNYDTSYLFEDEYGLVFDWFYFYYVSWGKLFYFVFFILEEAARLSLAFYVCYLITFEIHSVNCSYNEDFFLNKKRSL